MGERATANLLGCHPMLAWAAVMLWAGHGVAAPALPQFLGVDPISHTTVEIIDEQLKVDCAGDPPYLDCTSTAVQMLRNPTTKAVRLELEVDGAVAGWSVNNTPMDPKGETTGDNLIDLASPVTLGPLETVRVEVTYKAVRLDGSDAAASFQIKGFDFSPPLSYRHPSIARPPERGVAVELVAKGARADRYASVAPHSVRIAVPASWLIHSTTGLSQTTGDGWHVISASSTASPPLNEPRFKTNAVLQAPPHPFPLGPFGEVGVTGWDEDCPSCRGVRLRGGADIWLSYWWSLGTAVELAESKRVFASATIDLSLPVYDFRSWLPMVTIGAGSLIGLSTGTELGFRAQLVPGYRLGPVFVGGALLADWFPLSKVNRWEVSPMFHLAL